MSNTGIRYAGPVCLYTLSKEKKVITSLKAGGYSPKAGEVVALPGRPVTKEELQAGLGCADFTL